jgi:hypothetical protein
MPSSLIEKYIIRYGSNGFTKSIFLRKGAENIGVLIFRPDASTLPQDKNINGYIVLHYHMQDFRNVLHILEHEKPVSLVYKGSQKGDENGIITGDGDVIGKTTMVTTQPPKASNKKRDKGH